MKKHIFTYRFIVAYITDRKSSQNVYITLLYFWLIYHTDSSMHSKFNWM